MKSPAEPYALPFSRRSDAVHAVVPVSRAHQGQTVASNRETAVERARTMLEDRPGFRRYMGLKICLFLVRREPRSVEERNDLIQQTRIARDFEIMADRVRQP